ncbi:MAG: lysine exporter LysO family protein [Synergistetes bacterium]|nr:MAG: hypothetical protein XD52_1091 [bacterium 42_11]MBC7330888.1 lysine exporter LysO family protein [Synergistota bacterium]MDK2870847.1 hypothetical protein [bacterium]
MNFKPLLILFMGIAIGYLNPFQENMNELNSTAIKLALLCLFLTIGVDMGKDPKLWDSIKLLKRETFMIASAGLLGSLLGGAIASLLSNTPLSTSLASAAGSGYYSITTLMLKEVGGAEQALIGFISNLIRELLVIVGMPLIVKIFGRAGAVAAAGATAMDTSLPFVIKSAGKEIGILSFASGVVISILVPFLVPTIYRILSNLGW